MKNPFQNLQSFKKLLNTGTIFTTIITNIFIEIFAVLTYMTVKLNKCMKYISTVNYLLLS